MVSLAVAVHDVYMQLRNVIMFMYDVTILSSYMQLNFEQNIENIEHNELE